MIWKNILLQVSAAQKQQLLKHRNKISAFLEKGNTSFFSQKDVDGLFAVMSEMIAENKMVQEAVNGSESSGDHVMLNFQYEGDDILNLPWQAAKDGNGKLLDGYNQLFLVKSLSKHFDTEKVFSALPYPLKVLVVISSPEDASFKGRLSYEEEELQLLSAFDPLMTKGLVELDFADDASLETLKEKITNNQYHILHFSGHAYYKEEEKTGYVVMEDYGEMNRRDVSGKEFAETINNPKNKIPLVVISSCQSAQGDAKDDLGGITQQLIRVGIPAVIAMGLSVNDRYAMHFTTKLYQQIANNFSLHQSFKEAINHMKAVEFEEYAKNGINRPALQWIIPNLYVSQPFEQLIDREAAPQKLALQTNRHLLFGERKLLIEHSSDYVFVGRRKDRRRIFKHLLENTPVLLKGQGGVGKSAMAEHLVQRYLIRNPKTVVFAFDEKDLSINAIIVKLEECLKLHGNYTYLTTLKSLGESVDKIGFLVNQVKEKALPFFIFDNLETFQKAPGEAFAENYIELEKAILSLIKSQTFPVILTGRYPLETEGISIEVFDLNNVSFSDYWRKAHYLKNLTKNGEQSKLPFVDSVKFLYKSLGGNYRSLEMYDKLLGKEDVIVINAELSELQEANKNRTAEVIQEMSRDLIFDRLMNLLDENGRRVLHCLSHFQIPVTKMSLQLQGIQEEAIQTIQQIHELTLVEKTEDSQKRNWYYVTPLLKELIKNYDFKEPNFDFSHEKAGRYYLYVFENNINYSITPLIQSFDHYCETEQKEKIGKLGTRISRICHSYYLHKGALNFGLKTYELLKEHTPSELLTRIGLLFYHFGKYDNALSFYQDNLKKQKELGDKSGESMMLNNISEIFLTRSDYKSALNYLEESLVIIQELGDKSREGKSLNNIGQILQAQGDYKNALKYLEASLSISQELEDKSAEGTTLNNIGQIYTYLGDYETALKHLKESLSIMKEVGNKSVEAKVLFNLALTYLDPKVNQPEKGLDCLKQVIEINKTLQNAEVADALESLRKQLGLDKSWFG